MSVSSPSGGGKSANYELNLVPFIDLFSALICFLLMTAAWQNLEVLPTGDPAKTGESRDDSKTSLNDSPQPVKTVLSVTLYFDRVDLAENYQSRAVTHRGGKIDLAEVAKVLDVWKKRYPAKKDVLLSTENRAPYKNLISLMDSLIGAGFPEVGITLN